MAKYEISGLEFNTKKAITEHCRDILKRHQEEERIKPEDAKFLYGLIQQHESVDQKVGCGIDYFVKSRSDWGKYNFNLVRIDGSRTDFSFVHCITPKSPLQDVRAAGRSAVRPDILEFKVKQYETHADKEGHIYCPLSNKPVSFDEAHVDHTPPNTFDYIFKGWMQDKDPTLIEILGFEDGAEHKHFKDEEIKQDFRQYHNQLALLRITSAYGNLTQKKKF